MFNQLPDPTPFKVQIDKVPQHHAYQFTERTSQNRKPSGDSFTIKFEDTSRNVQLYISQKTLDLAFSQLQVHDKDVFQGFLAGQVDFVSDEDTDRLQLKLDRFDPGRYSHSKMFLDKAKIPTATLPGDICVPILLQHGMAFVDHQSSETYTSIDFTKAFHVLKNCLYMKEKLDLSQFMNMKIKCCFDTSGDEVLAYISACGVFMTTEINLYPVNTVPIIPTALARNLEEELNLSDTQSNIRSGFMTMDQTRKLLLVIDSDPKVSALPLVGIWISGLESPHCAEVWACCVRFLFNDDISERVHAPPENYLLLIYSPTCANPLFYEFSKKSIQDGGGIEFGFVSVCEGIQMQKSNADEDEIYFEMTGQSSGLLRSNFDRAIGTFLGDRPVNQQVVEAEQTLDDSLPKSLHPLSPHPHILNKIQTPSSLDVSICESVDHTIEGDDVTHNASQVPDTKSKSPPQQVNNTNLKHPRPTKASLIRMNLNKPSVKSNQRQETGKQRRLAINSEKESKAKKKEIVSKEVALERVDQYIELQNERLEEHSEVESDRHDESFPRLPVAIRQGEQEDPVEKNHKSMSVILEPTYCPDNYSDFEERSFRIESSSVNDSFDIPTYTRDNGAQQGVCDVSTTSTVEGEEMPQQSKINERSDTQNEKSGTRNEQSSEKNELYQLLFEQQSQLAALQKQLQVFLTHQEKQEELQSEKKEKQVIVVQEKKESKETVSEEFREVQIAQQKQLQDLQDQVQLFLQQSLSNEKKESVDTSVQCATPITPMSTSPVLMTTGVNTGRSLLWPSENMATTQSDTAPRGTQQAVLPSTSKEKRKNRKSCRCCHHHCDKSDGTSTASRRKSYPNPQDRSQSYEGSTAASLSEIQSEDIQSPLFNDTANSSQTIASSLKGVDMPVFDESQETTPFKKSEAKVIGDEWNTSPQLGESASVLVEQKRLADKQQHAEEIGDVEGDVESNVEENLLNNKEFYEQMMFQVQKLISAQSTVETLQASTQNDDHGFVNPPALTSEEKLQRVRDATSKELQKLVLNNESLRKPNEEKRVVVERQRSMSAATPPHPTINYVSMSVDDTLYDYSTSNIDNIAAKYVPTELLQSEVRNSKTVKFEGVYQLETASRTGVINKNTTSVNFSCNMSIASRKYLQKYELASRDESMRAPLKDQNGRLAAGRKRDDNEETEGKENHILDLKKLRSLAKLK